MDIFDALFSGGFVGFFFGLAAGIFILAVGASHVGLREWETACYKHKLIPECKILMEEFGYLDVGWKIDAPVENND